MEMRTDLIRYFLIVFGLCSLLSAKDYKIHHNINSLVISKEGLFDVIDYTAEINGSELSPERGAPDLPVYIYRIVLPTGETVTDFSIRNISESKLPGVFNVRPRPAAWTQFTPENDSENLPASTNWQGSYPALIAEYLGTRHFNGVPVAHFAVSPARFNAADGSLYFITEFELHINSDADQRETVKPLLEADRRAASSLLESRSGTMDIAPSAALIPDGEAALSGSATETSALESGVIDRYVIITTDELAGAFQPLAEWKRRKGVPTVIRALSWIDANFQGVDEAERIRNFIKWAYQKRGLKYVMLAGDVDLVPTRVITTGGYKFAADYYYADLDGSWNANQNDIFGEAADKLDGYPEVYVARTPVSTIYEAQRFIKKLLLYEKLPGSTDMDYPANILYTAANLSNSNDGRDLILKNIDPQISASFKRKWLTQNADIGKNGQVVIDELNKSYGLIFTESHGMYHNIRPGASGSNIYEYQMDALTNPLPQIWYMASCYTNDILKRSFSKSFMRSPTGGGVAYIGNSSFEYPFSGIFLQKEFYRLLFHTGNYHLSEAHFLSRLPYLGYLTWEGPSRIIVYSTTVLGDPEMPVWTARPVPFVVASSEEIISGQRFLKVTVTDSLTNLAAPGAMVVLYQENQYYRIGMSDASGVALFSGAGLPSLDIEVTVTGHNYKPWQGKANLSPQPGGYLYLADHRFEELQGNGDGIAGPDESFSLSAQVVSASRGVLNRQFGVQLSCENPAVEIVLAEADTVAKIQPGDSLWIGPMKLRITDALTADTSLAFKINLYSDGYQVGEGRVTLEALLPDLRIIRQSSVTDSVDDGYQTRMTLSIINSGRGAAQNIVLELSATEDSVVFETSRIELGSLFAGETARSPAPFVFYHSAPADSLHLQLAISDRRGFNYSAAVDLFEPPAPGSLRWQPVSFNAVLLSWKASPANDLAGYLVFRRLKSESNFQQINSAPVSPAGYYLDSDVRPGEEYGYLVQALDVSGNVSPMSADTVWTWPTLSNQPGFPIDLPYRAIGSELNGVTVYDLDNDGRNELISSGSNGLLHIYRDSGEIWRQINGLTGNLTVPAAGNVYGDDFPEIVVSSYHEGFADNSVFIIDPVNGILTATLSINYNAPTSAVLKDLDGDGYHDIMALTHAGNAPAEPKNGRLLIWRSSGTDWNPFPLWTNDGFVFNDWYPMGTPAAADIDHSGEISVIVGSPSGKLFAFKPLLSFEPVWIKELAGYLNAQPSLADINLDGFPEIIVPAAQTDKLYVLDYNGDPVSGWESGQSVEITDPYTRMSPAIPGNLDQDAELEIVYAGRSKLYLFEHDGSLKSGWNVPISNGDSEFDPNRDKRSPYNSPVLADLNQDGSQEIIFLTTYGIIHAIDARSGKNIAGFPIDLGNDAVNGQSPLVDDLDRDSDFDLIFVGHEGILNCWDTPNSYTNTTLLFWSQPYANAQHTGELDTTIVNIISAIGPEDISITAPEQFWIKRNYPNPFNSQTTILLGVPVPALAELEIFNLAGQKVVTLHQGEITAGVHPIRWNGKNSNKNDCASGIYFYRAEFKEASSGARLFVKSGKMILLR
jgi:hypothetical protein